MNRIPATARQPIPISEVQLSKKKLLKIIHQSKHFDTAQLRWYKSEPMGADEAIKLAHYFSNKPSVIELKIHEANFLNNHSNDLVNFLEKNHTISTLKLLNSTINNNGFGNIAQALKNNTSLKKLKLSGNETGDDVSKSIAEVIKSNTSLTELNLTDFNVDDEGIEFISEALKTNTTLTKLNLSDNLYCHQSAGYLALAIAMNTAITHLDIRKNTMDIIGYKILLSALIKNTTLTTVGIDKEIPEFYSSSDDAYSDLILDDDLSGDDVDNFDAAKDSRKFPQLYENIQSIYQRNREKESLLARATPVLKVLAPELPAEISDLIARQLLIAESNAAALRHIGDLI